MQALRSLFERDQVRIDQLREEPVQELVIEMRESRREVKPLGVPALLDAC